MWQKLMQNEHNFQINQLLTSKDVTCNLHFAVYFDLKWKLLLSLVLLDYLSIAAQAKMTQVHNIFMPANRNYIKRLWIYESHIFELRIKTWVWKWSSHQYHRGYGFKSRTGLNFFGLIFTTAQVVFITAKMAFILKKLY